MTAPAADPTLAQLAAVRDELAQVTARQTELLEQRRQLEVRAVDVERKVLTTVCHYAGIGKATLLRDIGRHYERATT